MEFTPHFQLKQYGWRKARKAANALPGLLCTYAVGRALAWDVHCVWWLLALLCSIIDLRWWLVFLSGSSEPYVPPPGRAYVSIEEHKRWVISEHISVDALVDIVMAYQQSMIRDVSFAPGEPVFVTNDDTILMQRGSSSAHGSSLWVRAFSGSTRSLGEKLIMVGPTVFQWYYTAKKGVVLGEPNLIGLPCDLRLDGDHIIWYGRDVVTWSGSACVPSDVVVPTRLAIDAIISICVGSARLAILYHHGSERIIYANRCAICLPAEIEIVSVTSAAFGVIALTSTGKVVLIRPDGPVLHLPTCVPVRKITTVSARPTVAFLALFSNGDLLLLEPDKFTVLETSVDDVFSSDDAYVTVRYDPFRIDVRRKDV